MSKYLCPECNEPTIAIETRSSGRQIRRRRSCTNKHRFSTIEVSLDVSTKIQTVIDWALKESVDADMLEYVKSQIQNIILGITEED